MSEIAQRIKEFANQLDLLWKETAALRERIDRTWNAFVEAYGLGPGTNINWINATVNTTDATPTTLYTFATTTNHSYYLDGYILARRTGGSAGSPGDTALSLFFILIKNVSGVVTLAVNEVGELYEDQAGWDASASVSGTNVLLQVTGAVNNNITWVVGPASAIAN